MRVAIVAEGPDERAGQAGGLANALACLGHEVTVSSSTAEWARARPDVVHLRSWTAGPAAAAAVRLGIPIVYTCQAQADATTGHLQIEDVLLHAADHVVVPCADEATALIGRGVPSARVSVVPDGVDVDLFDAVGGRAPRGQPRRVVAVGEPGPHAGFSTAVAALGGLPRTELVVVAEPAANLRRYAQDLSVADRLHFTGHLPRAQRPALLRSADVVVCTPWRTASVTAAVEAMACGVPVVASDVGMLSDAVLDRLTGLLVPPRRPRILATALRRLLADLVTREQYGASGRARACARYSWERVVEETLQVYERVGVPLNRSAEVRTGPTDRSGVAIRV
jgi:glycosyltransferase involved in cell wall biosynthesis